MTAPLDPQLAAFSPISLAALNAKAAMLERLDQKYITSATQLGPALADLRAHFDILEIEGRRAFTYATRYFDDPGNRSYYDHLQGRRKRCKIRTRHYVEANLNYLEVKLKDRRDVTVKKRLALAERVGGVDDTAASFINTCHSDLYGTPLGLTLTPSLGMVYERITLVARQGGERMTIDTRIIFDGAGQKRAISPDLFILETKSARGYGLADRVMRQHGIAPTKRVSKYCVGMAAMGLVPRFNPFLPALRKLGLCAATGEQLETLPGLLAALPFPLPSRWQSAAIGPAHA